MADSSIRTNTYIKNDKPMLPRVLHHTLKYVKDQWHTHIAFDFIAEENNLVDHLANERTWHNWLATSNAIAWMGIVVAQMSKIDRIVRLKHAHMLRKKACLCQGLAIAILLIGTYRFFREQSAINGNGSRASQWSLLAAGLLILAVGERIRLVFTELMTNS